MKPTFSKEEWKEILMEVYRRASTDMQFRELCLEDAKEAIRQASGKDLPQDVKIRFSDQKKEIILTLHKNRAHELSDAQLEIIAGGIAAIPWTPLSPST
jgi:hypothetical protein